MAAFFVISAPIIKLSPLYLNLISMIKNNVSPSLCFTFLLGSLLLALGIFAQITEPLMQFDRTLVNQGQWWRLMTSQLIHYGIYHLAMNIIALLLCGYILLRQLTLISYSGLLIVCISGVGAGLYYGETDLHFYAGFSGVLHGFIFAGLILNWREAPWFYALASLALVGKLFNEQSAGFDTNHPLLPVPVAVDAHLYGTLSGLIFASIILAASLLRRRKNTPDELPK